jgi:hypothetical protein
MKVINEIKIRKDFNRLLNEGVPIPNLKALFGMIGRNADDLIKSFGDDAVKNMEMVLNKAFSNTMNIGVDDLGRQCIKSGSSGSKLPLETLSSALDGINSGFFTVDDIITTLPRYLPDGTEFRDVFEKALKQKVVSQAVRNIKPPSWLFKWVNDDVGELFSKLFPKCKKVENLPFNPKEIKLLNRVDGLYQRDILEIKLPTGDDILIYKSSGLSGSGTKQKDDWVVIAGFGSYNDPTELGWFVKSEQIVKFTLGDNQYLTKLHQFLRQNGPEGLGK